MSNVRPWSAPVGNIEAACRAGGRRGYNAHRQAQALVRRLRVAELLGQSGFHRGALARLARELGVSKATITRDVQSMLPIACFCPCCARLVPREGLPALLTASLARHGRGLTPAAEAVQASFASGAAGKE